MWADKCCDDRHHCVMIWTGVAVECTFGRVWQQSAYPGCLVVWVCVGLEAQWLGGPVWRKGSDIPGRALGGPSHEADPYQVFEVVLSGYGSRVESLV